MSQPGWAVREVRCVLGELDLLVAQTHADDSHSCAEDALQAVCLCPATSTSGHRLEGEHVLEERDRRSMSDTVMPTASTECAIAVAARGVADGSDQATNATTTIRVRTSAHPFQQVIADAQGVGHDRQRGLTAPLDGKKLPSTTYRLSRSCALHIGSSADVLGSRPKRIVPF